MIHVYEKLLHKKNFTFYLNQLIVIENLRRHCLYAIIRKKTLFDIRSKFFSK